MRYIAGVIVIIILLGLIGYFITPREGGDVLILSPSVKAVQGWRYKVRQTQAALERIGHMIEQGLDENETLLARSQALERALKECFELEKELEIAKPPLAYQKEQEKLVSAVMAFAEAARLGVIYLNEPAVENFEKAKQALEKARMLMKEGGE